MLDIGCGTGFLLSRLRRNKIKCVGLDISEGMLAVARSRLGRRFPLVQGDARELPFVAQSFDAIVCARVLSHVEKPLTVIEEMGRIARPEAFLLISDVDPGHSYNATKVPSEKGRLEVETFKHNPDSIFSLAKSAGFVLLDRWNLRADTVAWMPPMDQLRSLDRTGLKGAGYMLLMGKKEKKGRKI